MWRSYRVSFRFVSSRNSLLILSFVLSPSSCCAVSRPDNPVFRQCPKSSFVCSGAQLAFLVLARFLFYFLAFFFFLSFLFVQMIRRPAGAWKAKPQAHTGGAWAKELTAVPGGGRKCIGNAYVGRSNDQVDNEWAPASMRFASLHLRFRCRNVLFFWGQIFPGPTVVLFRACGALLKARLEEGGVRNTFFPPVWECKGRVLTTTKFGSHGTAACARLNLTVFCCPLVPDSS